MSALPIDQLDTLILDLGGVLIDVDYARSARAFEALGIGGFEEQFSKARQTRLFDEFETGAISASKFCEAIADLFSGRIKEKAIINCWNAMLGTVPPERMVLVEMLRMRYRVALLSNTNTIHIPAFRAIIKRDLGIADFDGEFDGAFYSCAIGLRKPDAEVYQHVLRAMHASPERSLFIDDSIQHVEGARKAGLHAEHLDLSKEDVLKMVDRMGLLA